jgi:hypothetical protein
MAIGGRLSDSMLHEQLVNVVVVVVLVRWTRTGVLSRRVLRRRVACA